MSRDLRANGRLALGIALACSSSDGPVGTSGPPPAPPPGESADVPLPDGATSTAGTEPEPEPCCARSEQDNALVCTDCPDESFCVTRRELGVVPEPEAFTCQPTCVPTDAAGLQCATSASCCDPEATCESTGYCRVESDSTKPQ